MSDHSLSDVDVAIVASEQRDLEAILPHLQSVELVERQTKQYIMGEANAHDGTRYKVAVVPCIEQNSGEAQTIARDVIDDLSPQLILVVGTACALPYPHYSLGDAVFSTRVLDLTVSTAREDGSGVPAYGGGKISASILSRIANLPVALSLRSSGWNEPPSFTMTAPVIVQDGPTAFSGSDDLKQRALRSIQQKFQSSRSPRVVCGTICTGVPRSENADVTERQLGKLEQIYAIDAESGGIFLAAQSKNNVPFVTVRGLSHLLGYKHPHEQEHAWTIYASHVAAAAAMAFLKTKPINRRAPASLAPPLNSSSFPPGSIEVLLDAMMPSFKDTRAVELFAAREMALLLPPRDPQGASPEPVRERLRTLLDAYNRSGDRDELVRRAGIAYADNKELTGVAQTLRLTTPERVRALRELASGKLVCNGRYKLVKKVGDGYNGAVYHVETVHERTPPHGPIVVKFLFGNRYHSQPLREAIKDRIEKLRSKFNLADSFYPQVYEVDFDSGLQCGYITLDLVEGQTVEDIVKSQSMRPALRPAQALEIARQILRHLAIMARQGVVHGDLNPENIMVKRSGETYSVSFLNLGLSTGVRRHPKHILQYNTPLTILYAAPEQHHLRDDHDLRPCADLWSFGLVVYYMLVGKHFWQRELDAIETGALDKFFTRKMHVPSAMSRAAEHDVLLPPAFGKWFDGCVALDVDQRTNDIDACLRQLESVWPYHGTFASVQMNEQGPSRDSNSGQYSWRDPTGVEIPMIHVPPGATVRTPEREPVVIDHEMYVCRFPITVGEFRRFVIATGHSGSSWNSPKIVQEEDHPVVCVAWKDAKEYCRWAGLRLLSSEEWEYVAFGNRATLYPWGDDEPTDAHLWWSGVNQRSSTAPVGTHPLGASPWGVLDLAGNVSEWTSSLRTHEGKRISRGNNWIQNRGVPICNTETHKETDFCNNVIGFRCVWSPARR